MSWGSSISCCWGGRLSIALRVLKRLMDLVLRSPLRSPLDRLLDPDENVEILGFKNRGFLEIDLVSEFSLSTSNLLTFSALYFFPLLWSFLAVELLVSLR